MSFTCVIGDVHGNLPALEARIEEIEAMAVAGNHDLGSRRRLGLSLFNREARLASGR